MLLLENRGCSQVMIRAQEGWQEGEIVLSFFFFSLWKEEGDIRPTLKGVPLCIRHSIDFTGFRMPIKMAPSTLSR